MSDTWWSFLLAAQALLVTAVLADGRWRVAGCWFGLITEPLWIWWGWHTGDWGFALLGGVYLLMYVWGILNDRLHPFLRRTEARLHRGRDTKELLDLLDGPEWLTYEELSTAAGDPGWLTVRSIDRKAALKRAVKEGLIEMQAPADPREYVRYRKAPVKA